MKRYSIIAESHKPAVCRHHKIDNYRSYTESKVYEPSISNVVVNRIVHESVASTIHEAMDIFESINRFESFNNLASISNVGLSLVILVNEDDTIKVSKYYLIQKEYVDSLVSMSKLDYKRIIACNINHSNDGYIARFTVLTKKEIHKILSVERERILMLDGNEVYDKYTYNLLERPKIEFIGGCGDSDFSKIEDSIPNIFLNYDCFDV